MPRCERREQAMTCVYSEKNISSVLGLLIDNRVNCSGREQRPSAWAFGMVAWSWSCFLGKDVRKAWCFDSWRNELALLDCR